MLLDTSFRQPATYNEGIYRLLRRSRDAGCGTKAGRQLIVITRRGAKWPRHSSAQLAQARGSMLDALYSVCSRRGKKRAECVTELRSEADAEVDRIRSLRPSFRATCHRLTRSCCLVWSCVKAEVTVPNKSTVFVDVKRHSTNQLTAA